MGIATFILGVIFVLLGGFSLWVAGQTARVIRDMQWDLQWMVRSSISGVYSEDALKVHAYLVKIRQDMDLYWGTGVPMVVLGVILLARL